MMPDNTRQFLIYPPDRSEAERALDRFWMRDKTNIEKGELYERYIGYLYEDAGYQVDYYGIRKGFKDRGRDFICRSGSQVLIIQCKNWESGYFVMVNSVHQLRGTVDEYSLQYPHRKAHGILFTTSKV